MYERTHFFPGLRRKKRSALRTAEKHEAFVGVGIAIGIRSKISISWFYFVGLKIIVVLVLVVVIESSAKDENDNRVAEPGLHRLKGRGTRGAA